MSDKIRGALFNALGDIRGLRVLDAFSGSGAVAIEAVSRDAEYVVAVESDAQAQRCITQNLASLGTTNVVLQRVALHTWLQAHPSDLFDVVIADPPYDEPQPQIIEKLPNNVRTGGLFVISWPVSVELPRLDSCKLIRDKIYGTARLLFYRC